MVVAAMAGPHAEHVAQFGTPEALLGRPQERRRVVSLPPPSPGPDLKVYGYLAYWSDDLPSVPWDELSHLAVFAAAAETDGSLSLTERFDIAPDAVALAAPYGVRVHLTVTNFDRDELRTLLGSASARTQLVSELAAWQQSTGAHGINVDFENLPGDRRVEMVSFVQELEAAVGEVVLATPSVDWSDAWDYAALTDHADLFIMGYGYHWSGASYAGPTDPLYAGGGTVWEGVNSFSLSWSADDYLSAGADPDRVILGLPLYGMRWPTASDAVPSLAEATGSSIVFADAWEAADVYGQTYEADSHALTTHDGVDQLWFGDVATVRDRIAYARDVAGVGGIGFWALHYDGDDPAMWDMIRDETTFGGSTTPTDTDSPSEDTGVPEDTGTPAETDAGGDDLMNQVAPPPPSETGGCGCEHTAIGAPYAIWRRR